MTSLPRFWSAVELLPSLTAVEAEWRAHLRGEYQLIQPFLRPRRERAPSFPRVDGGLPYQVIEHGRNDLVGVCPETGEIIPLRKGQLILYELDQQRLAHQVATALGLPAAKAMATSEIRLFYLGVFRSADLSLETFLIFPYEVADVMSGAATLIAEGFTPLLLLTPTRRFVRAELELRFHYLKSTVLSLVDILMVSEDGRWHIAKETIQAALPNQLAKTSDTPLSGRAQLVLVAMLELKAIDSDMRQSTAAIAATAMGNEADANAIKPVMSDLAERQFIQTREGRGGDCWLTESGKLRAEKLQQA